MSRVSRPKIERAATAALGGLVLSVALGVAPSCKEPTTVSLVVETDVACESVTRSGVTITTGPDSPSAEAAVPNAVAQQCSPGGTLNLVGDLTLRRGGGDSLALRVVLGVDSTESTESACRPPSYAGCIVARRQLRYISESRLRVPVVLRQVCKGNPCDPDQTCVRGACVSALVSSEACARDGCDESTLLGGADAGVNDARDAGATDGTGPDGGLDGGMVSGKIVAGRAHACVLRDGRIQCWGANDFAQLAATAGGSAGPKRVPLVDRDTVLADDLAAGGDHTCALAQGALYCWGSNATGQIAASASLPSPALMVPSGVSAVAADNSSTCFVRITGPPARICLGGSMATFIDSEPVTALATSATSALRCNLRGSPQNLYCEGSPPWVGFATGGPLWGGRVDHVTLGESHGCLESSGVTYCWGDNSFGQIVGTPGGFQAGPRAAGPVTRASTRWRHTCALAPEGVTCWGENAKLQVSPVVAERIKTHLLTQPVSAAAGDDFSCALLASGEVYCWGDNTNGQLGANNAVGDGTPQRVPLW